MPSAPKRLCQTPACPGRTDKGNLCDSCRKAKGRDRRQRDKQRRGPQIYNRSRWARFRSLMLKQNAQTNAGLCVRCRKRLADQVHHVVDVAVNPSLVFVAENTECLCASCHSKETVKRQGWS